MGTAVNVQMTVFGNIGDTSGTGVRFTRNPSTREHKFFGLRRALRDSGKAREPLQ
jgi:pyruvate,orthophosphate dikinase